MKPRTTSTIIIVLALIANLGLACLPVIPRARLLLPTQPTARDELEWQIRVIGIGFALFTLTIGVVFLRHEKENERFRESMREYLPVTKIAQIRDDQFYSDFLHAASEAKNSVNIMYLAPHPPDDTNDQVRLRYYRDLVDLIRRNTGVKFNRIMRQTPENKGWIEGLIRDLTGCPNASLVVIRDSESEEMPLSLSMQVIDSLKVWFVAVAGHERRGPYRDLFIENEQVAETMQHYYDRLWDRGKKLLDAGRITPEGKKFVAPREPV